jgi:hypothetical protein
MTGTGGGRDDWPTSSVSDKKDGQGNGSKDPCAQVRSGPINSPKANVLGALKVGAVLDVAIDQSGPRPVLVVRDSKGNIGGSLTFRGYLDLIECMNNGYAYTATITNISGGVYTVMVAPA